MLGNSRIWLLASEPKGCVGTRTGWAVRCRAEQLWDEGSRLMAEVSQPLPCLLPWYHSWGGGHQIPHVPAWPEGPGKVGQGTWGFLALL